MKGELLKHHSACGYCTLSPTVVDLCKKGFEAYLVDLEHITAGETVDAPILSGMEMLEQSNKYYRRS